MIKKIRTYIILILLLTAFFNTRAQQFSSAINRTILFKPTPGFYLSALQKVQGNNPGISLAKNYAALPLPFFCNLESRLHRRANVWIKLRTGNDESYQRLISPLR